MGRQRFEPRSHIVVVEVKIEGQEKRWTSLRMALDTGASLTVIPWSAAETLGLDPARGRRRVRFMTGNGMEAAPVLTIHAMEVLGIRVGRVPALCHDLPQRSLVDGLLGLSFLRHCQLSINFRRGVLELTRAS